MKCGQDLFDWDPVRMPSLSSLTDAASNWVQIREDARAELRLGVQVTRRPDKDAVVAELDCVEKQLKASQRKVNKLSVRLSTVTA